MKLSPYAIQNLVPFITGNNYPPSRTGRQLVKLFNKYGCRDIYDEFGLPERPGSFDNQRMSRKAYVEDRLKQLVASGTWKGLLKEVIESAENRENVVNEINALLRGDKLSVVKRGESYEIEGGIIDNTPPVQNTAHFEGIQNQILSELNKARVSITVVMAWFTNELLFKKLKERAQQGIDVKLAIYDDGINRKYGLNFDELNLFRIKKSPKGGLMHDKFCIIDNQVVITGSYNWTNNAEFRNSENITIQKDLDQASSYSEEFRRLTSG